MRFCAQDWTRTSTPYGTTPSKWRVYQFHHLGIKSKSRSILLRAANVKTFVQISNFFTRDKLLHIVLDFMKKIYIP